LSRLAGFSEDTAKQILAAYQALVRSGLLSVGGASRDAVQPGNYIYVSNASGEVIPPFACMQANGTEETTEQNYITVRRPVDKYGVSGPYFFNGPDEIEVGGLGIANAGPMARMFYLGAFGGCGSRYEPTVGAWSVSNVTNGPFIAIGLDDVASNTMKGIVTYNYDFTYDCNDSRRPITQIRWESPKLQYRKGAECDWVDILTGTSCGGPTAAPSSLSSTATTTTTVSLAWTDNSTNEDGFFIEYKTTAGSTWTVFETTAANATTSTVTGLTASTSYDFRVAAMNSYGTSSYVTITGISTAAEP
jgi:Fibronectin type III domain